MTRAEERLILSYTERGGRQSAWQKLAEAAAIPATGAADPPEPPGLPSGVAAGSVVEEILDAPMVDGQHDSTAAVTSVALFHACPRKYYLSRYLMMEPTVEQVTLGSEVHGILAGGHSESEEARELARRFEAGGLGKRASRAARIEREFDFLLAIDDVVLRGQIDLWFEESGELILVDYKTDREESPEAYALQLRLYALALERYLGRLPDRAVLYYLRSDRPLEVSLQPTDLDAARAAVRAFSNAQEALIFPLHEGEQCRRCSFYRGLCPAAV